MLRRHVSCPLLAPFIPRSVWDVAHANPNWTDSYASDIADRRHWPARRWSIGLEPRTPHEWLNFSHRNLAYAYNGAMRACDSFAEMLVYYKEMKVRGVKVDVDTMNLLLSRAARFDGMLVDDIFALFDELVGLGARVDVASVEILQTVLEHSAHQSHAWRECKRRQLMECYNALALEEVERLRGRSVEALLAAQLQRLRVNVRLLKGRLSPRVFMVYFSALDSAEQLLREVHNYLWDFVEPNHPATELPLLNMRIPCITTVLRRPRPSSSSANGANVVATAHDSSAKSTDRSSTEDANDSSSSNRSQTIAHCVDAQRHAAAGRLMDFEDCQVCAVLLAALERAVDRDFSDGASYSERRVYLGLLAMIVSSGVMYTSGLMAQLMDCVKYSRDEQSRDRDAVRLLRYALRVTSVRVVDDSRGYRCSSYADARSNYNSIDIGDNSNISHGSKDSSVGRDAMRDSVTGVLTRRQRDWWTELAPVVDGRVVGRYLASRDAWSDLHICYDNALQFGYYPVPQLMLNSGSRQSEAILAKQDSRRITDKDADGDDRSGSHRDSSQVGSVSAKRDAESAETAGTALASETVEEATETTAAAMSTLKKTAEAFQRRWRDISALIERTGVLQQYRQPRARELSTPSLSSTPAACAMEVFTGMMAFLRNTITGQRYGSLEDAFTTQAIGDRASSNHNSHKSTTIGPLFDAELTVPLCRMILQCLEEARFWMERFMDEFNTFAQNCTTTETSSQLETGNEKDLWVALRDCPAEPEFECWEAMLVTLRSIMDFCVVQKQQQQLSLTASSSRDDNGPSMTNGNEQVGSGSGSLREVDQLFQRASRLRTQLVSESKTRFGGRMRILWLHES